MAADQVAQPDATLKRSPPRRLVSHLPDDMIRAVPGDVALEGYGRHWKGNVTGRDDFFLSRDTKQIDDFISHDWHTPGFVKYVTLCYIYNGRAAVLGGALFGVIFTIAKETYLQPVSLHGVQVADFVGASLVSPLVFLCLFFHWHNVRAMVGKRNLLFVDKLCISQQDEARKAQGVLGLAAFLKRSKRLVVLWSPAYFTRLWCTYELATWFRYEKALSSVEFVPVQISPRLLVGFLAVAVMGAMQYIEAVIDASGAFDEAAPRSLIRALICFSGWVAMSYVFQSHIGHVAGLQQELENFRVQRSSCFCCSNDHRHPENGARLVCDRELVYQTLQEWVGGLGEQSRDHEHLAVFNQQVRTTLRQYVRGRSS
eukprot:TRINITY_DN20268_c0_g2_i1.p1 TRINITY_DN20268_c0_g2~~TRINITY_DN20268_c0_g2_i1.p1  ORF type:complete len:370 (-),score=18.45 TRINITY_DN20268_c0_g2_i1:1396-2505(-)